MIILFVLFIFNDELTIFTDPFKNVFPFMFIEFPILPILTDGEFAPTYTPPVNWSINETYNVPLNVPPLNGKYDPDADGLDHDPLLSRYYVPLAVFDIANFEIGNVFPVPEKYPFNVDINAYLLSDTVDV